MSVTRLIPANTPSQVNAENIGVQIQLPPPTTVIDSITVNYSYETVEPSDLIYLEDDGQGNLIPSNTGALVVNLDWVDPDTGNTTAAGIIAYDQGDTVVINDETYVRLGSSSFSNLYYPNSQGLVENTPLYFIIDDGQGNYTLQNSQYTVGPELTPSSIELCIFEPMNEQTGYGQAVDTNGYTYGLQKVGGNWAILNGDTGYFVCFVDATTNRGMELVAEPFNYTPGVETPSSDFLDYTQTPPALVHYWTWSSNGAIQYPLVAGGDFIATLVAPENNVQAGDTVIFSTLSGIAWNYNRMTVSSVQSHQEQNAYPSCQVEYSVDGQTWTAYPDYLTDYNNVICNIPRYMYLRFSQDVLITEE